MDGSFPYNVMKVNEEENPIALTSLLSVSFYYEDSLLNTFLSLPNLKSFIFLFLKWVKNLNTGPINLNNFLPFLFTRNRDQPFIVSNQNKRLTFLVTLKNKRESAYNTGIVVDFSENLFFASWTMPVCDDTLCSLLLCLLLVVNWPSSSHSDPGGPCGCLKKHLTPQCAQSQLWGSQLVKPHENIAWPCI